MVKAKFSKISVRDAGGCAGICSFLIDGELRLATDEWAVVANDHII